MHPVTIKINDWKHRRLLAKALWLEGFTIIWNIAEGLLAIIAGLLSNSVALTGFGMDSLIETTSAIVVGWRLLKESRNSPTQQIDYIEVVAAKMAGSLLLVLAVYVALASVWHLVGFGERTGHSRLGIVVTALSLIVMPWLATSKLKLAAQLESKALRSDALESVCCAWLSLTTLGGLALNSLFGWWWADSVAGLIIVPLLIREGLEAIRGEECRCLGECDSVGDS